MEPKHACSKCEEVRSDTDPRPECNRCWEKDLINSGKLVIVDDELCQVCGVDLRGSGVNIVCRDCNQKNLMPESMKRVKGCGAFLPYYRRNEPCKACAAKEPGGGESRRAETATRKCSMCYTVR